MVAPGDSNSAELGVCVSVTPIVSYRFPSFTGMRRGHHSAWRCHFGHTLGRDDNLPT